MGIKGLAEYFIAKYAGDADLAADDSLGAPINDEKVRILKDQMVKGYLKIEEDLTQLPVFQELNSKFVDNPFWNDFHRLMMNFVNYVEDNNLKKCFNYNVKLIEKLNELRFSLARDKTLEKQDAFALSEGVKTIQTTIWEESKRIINLHDLKGLLIRMPEAEKILQEKNIIPTWDYGPMKNPTQKSVMRMRSTPLTDMKKRWKQEEHMEQAMKKLGPYATQEEIDNEIKKILKDKRNETARKSEDKRKGKG